MLLTRNFSLSELINSPTADRLGIDNTPTHEEIGRLYMLCCNVLQPARDHFRKPIVINSGYRGPALNKAVGGAADSQHGKGEAVDIELAGGDNWELLRFIREYLPHDQIIAEYMIEGDSDAGWVHVSYREDNNRQVALIKNRGESYKQVENYA